MKVFMNCHYDTCCVFRSSLVMAMVKSAFDFDEEKLVWESVWPLLTQHCSVPVLLSHAALHDTALGTLSTHLVIKTISSTFIWHWGWADVEFLTAATPTCVMKLNLCVLSILQEVYSQTAQGCCCCIMYYFHSLCHCGLNLSQNAGCSLSLCVPCAAMGFLNNHGWAFSDLSPAGKLLRWQNYKVIQLLSSGPAPAAPV